LSCPPSANSKSSLFQPLTLASLLAEAKQTFTYFSMAHHNLGRSRTMPSPLGGFTSNINIGHENCFTKLKCSSRSQRGISQPKLEFITNHSNFTKSCWGGLTNALGMSIFVGGTSTLRRRRKLLYFPPTTSHCELVSRNWNIQFWNQNI
jgi:hypothetical protein